MPKAESWMISIRRTQGFGQTKIELEWSKKLLKIIVKHDVPTAAYGTPFRFRRGSQATIEKKGAQSCEAALGKVSSRGQAVETAHECLWTINSVIQVRVWSRGISWTGKNFTLALSSGISSTLCQQLRPNAYDGEPVGPNTGGDVSAHACQFSLATERAEHSG